jgi:hypothetical protein
MNIVTRYVDAVKRYLPSEQRDDIGDEILSILEGQIEDHAEMNDRPMSPEEEKDMLKSLGHPLKVAAEYGEHKTLISETLWPIYKQFVKYLLIGFLILWVSESVIEASEIIEGWPDNMGSALQSIVFWHFVIVTAVFSLAGEYIEKAGFLSKWEPEKLPDTEVLGKPVPLFDAVVNVVVHMVVFVVLCHVNNDYDWSTLSGSAENDWWTVVFWAKILTVGDMLVYASTLVSPFWTRPKLACFIVPGVGGLYLIHYARNIENIWRWADYTLAVAFVIVLVDLLYNIYRFVRITMGKKSEPPTATLILEGSLGPGGFKRQPTPEEIEAHKQSKKEGEQSDEEGSK